LKEIPDGGEPFQVVKNEKVAKLVSEIKTKLKQR